MNRPRAKINLLKDMAITEVSLVTAPMCPDADVLFTKSKPADWREAIRGDVVVDKARDVSGEPRDKSGKWTNAAINAIGGKRGSYRRQVAQAFKEKAQAIASGTVGHTVAAVASTRPTGANPVRGGGVHFGFEHRLKVQPGQMQGARITSSVQIRPEHLGPHPTETPNKAQRALHTLHRVLSTFNRPEVEPFGGTGKFSFVRASVHPGDMARTLFSSGGPSGGGSNVGTSTPAPTSTSAPSGGLGWQPSSMRPQWVTEAYDKKPVGHGRKTDISDPDAPQIPLQNHSARTAGGWSYYRNGKFIPSGRPDIQEHMERVHEELSRMPEDQRAGYIRNRTHAAAEQAGEDKGYFTQLGDYVPPTGQPSDQGRRFEARRRFEGAYGKERERLSTISNLHGAEHAPMHVPTPTPSTPAHRLFGENSPGGGREPEYDLGSPEQRAAAGQAFREDRTRKSLFAVPADFPVTRLPPGPHQQTLKWNIDRGPSFAVGVTAEESKLAKQRRRYAQAAVKAKIRG